MSSVTARIKEVKQPRGGYLKPSSMMVTSLEDGKALNENENIHASVIGMAADYLTRFMLGTDVRDAFKISIMGAELATAFTKKNRLNELEGYLKDITGLDDRSISNACKVVTFDVWYRNMAAALFAKGADETNPDKDTIENIRVIVERSLSFWNKFGPIKKVGFTFEEKGYTKTVDAGDGDYLTEDTLWDFKVSKSAPKTEHTLQLLMYYVMGKHSEKPEFFGIDKIGIYNPRLNKVYIADIKAVPEEIIRNIEKDVICYE